MIGGPWMPARNPLRLASDETPPRELIPPSWLPRTPTAEPLVLPKLICFWAPVCADAPSSLSSSRLTSMITASTNTWRRGMSSRSITFMRFRQSAWPAITTSELVLLSAVIFTSPLNSSAEGAPAAVAAGAVPPAVRRAPCASDCSVAATSSALALSR